MQLKTLFQPDADERGVSPVIGVILMVAITVILAAVIGTFVLGLGENINSTPQASWDFESAQSSGNVDAITITHAGGDTIEADRLSVTGAVNDDDSPVEFTDSDTGTFSSGDSVAAGDSITIEDGTGDIAIDGEQGDTVRLVYTAEGGGNSNVIATFELPADGASA